jgi:hypothetical protein
MKVGRKSKVCSWCFQSTPEKHCLGQDEERRRQEEEPQEAHTSPQTQGRHHHAQEDSILQAAIPQVIRHVDCEIWYNYVYNRYKANVYLNGEKVQELFDFSLQELKERLRLKIKQLDASSSSPLTKAVLWSSEPAAWDSAIEAFQIQAT